MPKFSQTTILNKVFTYHRNIRESNDHLSSFKFEIIHYDFSTEIQLVTKKYRKVLVITQFTP
jgi:hypothetical protein